MLPRRDWLIGAACLGAAAAAEGLRPRRRESLLNGAPLASVVPERFGPWRSKDVSGLVDTGDSSSLMNRLYAQVIQRAYYQTEQDDPIMLLVAYGANETNDLLLHRPEVCYPAFGFEIERTLNTVIPIKGAPAVPAKVLVAHAPDRNEVVMYWTRLGEAFPISGRAQRLDRLRDSIAGYITDGVLCRFSLTSNDPGGASQRMSELATSLIGATSPAYRPVLIGTARSRAISANARPA